MGRVLDCQSCRLTSTINVLSAKDGVKFYDLGPDSYVFLDSSYVKILI